MIKKLESLRDKLSDLSKRNRSLRLLKIYDKWNFDLSSLDNLISTQHASTSKIISSLFDNSDNIILLNSMTSEELALKLNIKINTLYRNLSILEEQTGIYDLYIGYPFVSGKMIDGTFIQAPVFLFPVRLEKNNGQSGWVLRLQQKEETFLNRTLLLAFQKYNNQKIDEQIMEDAKDLPQKGFQEWVSLLFQKYGINCYWAKRKVVPLHEYKSNELPKSPNNFVAIAPYLILGYFSQGSTTILKDYDELLEKSQENKELGFVNDLLLKEEQVDNNTEKEKNLEINLDDIGEDKQFFITNLDASQEKVIISAENEKGLVVHGPPGTGKSQVIVNLISQALANKKKILVVCQKRAALDIVNQRLEMQGLKDHVAIVHNANSDRKHLYTKIFKLLNKSNDDNAIEIENSFNKICSKIEIEKTYFKSFQTQSVKTRLCGLTIYELYNLSKKINKEDYFLELGDLPTKIDYESLESMKNVICKLGDYYGKYGNKDYPWVDRKSFYQMDYSSLIKIDKNFDTVIKIAQDINQMKDNNNILNSIKPVECWEFDEIIKLSIEKIDNFKNNKFLSDLKLLIFIKTKGKNFFAKFDVNNITLKQIKSDNFRIIEDNVTDINLYSQNVKEYIKQLSFLKDYLKEEAYINLVNQIKNGEIDDKKLIDMKKTLQTDAEDLNDMDNIKYQLDDNTSLIVKLLTKTLPLSFDEDLGEKWFAVTKQSFFMNWIEQAEKSYPNFKNVSTDTFDQHVKKLKDLLEEKTNITSLYINHILYKQIEEAKHKFSRNIKDINYQVSKVRKIWPIRRLMYTYWDKGLLDVMPVWLVSPETVSAIFPLIKGMFDVVIFDEASQCFVENGLPSFYRAKKVIVAGDEKQLSPFDLFKVGIDDSDLDNIDEEEYAQSLLTLSKRCYSTKLLAWHYRSKYEELINFSNYAFYNGLIKIAPNVMLDDYTKSLEWVKVDGKWENQCNIEEAETIVKMLRNIFNEHVDSSIGIITFNKKQQELIMDKIEEQSLNDKEFNGQLMKNNTKKLDEKLFIKNIENVQGDERDIIIFSIGYAKNEKGKVAANFGSLNKMGGENRLNVAITRAKQKIIIVSSILGEDLDVEHSKNPGPKLFKKYLRYAYAVSNNNKEQINSILYEMNENTSDITINDNFKCQVQKEIYNKLKQKGYKVDINVGTSGYKIDLAIINPKQKNKYVLGIELDDKMYHNARSIKEREIYRKQFIENKGWNIIKVWSRNWWKDQSKELKRIENIINEYS